jgi:predicted dehydrogenase
MCLAGYDWGPRGVDLLTRKTGKDTKRHATDPEGYRWQDGAAYMAECLTTGKKPLVTLEHVLHVLEVMDAVDRSHDTGQRVEIHSTFPWPI